MKHFANDRDQIVRNTIDGLIAASGGSITRLDGYPDIKVVVRTAWDKSQVSLISGGGSGHEPAHAGFVGEGLLTAAVCGEIFSSPSVDAVLAAILATTGPSGCLLIVKNYTGDRLNFCLAAEQAKALGFKVEVVIVSDDIALPDSSQPRGLAGTLFVHKIAGHMASEGRSLKEIAAAAREVAASIRTIGLAIETCSVPGEDREGRLGPDEAELGLGIHGEPGVRRISLGTSEEMATAAVSQLERTTGSKAHRYALLVNNLGGVPPLEMSVLLNDIARSALFEKIDYIVGPAPLMTALDMRGFSLSLLALDGSFLPSFLAPCQGAWPGVRKTGKVALASMPQLPGLATSPPSSNAQVEAILKASCKVFIEIERELNNLDAKVGDGDTGSTFANAARSILDHFHQLPCDEPAQLLSTLSRILSRNMGGSSGILMGIMLAGASKSFGTQGSWAGALLVGLRVMQDYGGAKRGQRTMIDALEPALELLAAGGTMSEAAKAARAGADATKSMTKASAGRSSYISERDLNGNIDPGAEAAARLSEVLAAL